ncbi:enoyl-CoA hydratase-related protein [Limobrevibacterium gyesilva]|uniref:Enoyl-CoA hydratase-related protein n=1 Tax=Limobrevibacterium gyesilva TaxID=2991712 RepID=A0AA41YNC1_9PROT|nr:enoyl-CoA hydratase-related protein [Limobrevibacterium gyesilva]MCW3473663.1 enoyl-CoA hydratase-related protein [Limobrevibacterium gyesilva]
MAAPVLLEVDARGVATVTLNRPELGNAYDADLLTALIEGLVRLEGDPAVRALVIRGAGRHFQAGADINWLARAAEYPPEEAFVASMATTRAMQLLNEFSKPTMAVVRGACFGGGCGIVCCVDVALATPDAIFGLTEVRVGVAPTPISTHMVHAMGLRHTRRYALTGERFDAAEACRIGLVHEVVAPEAIEQRVADVLDAVFLSAPGAIAATKRSFLAANGLTLDARAMAMLAHESWTQRNSAEGREGTAAFREKRRPAWYVPPLPQDA